MKANTLDDLSKEAYVKAAAGIKAFRAGGKTKSDEHELYAVLTNAGLSSESADEYINMETEQEGGW
jgi:uncharacterized protein (UPF0210 family)